MKKIFSCFVALLFTAPMLAQLVETKEELKGEVSTQLTALRLAAELVKYGYTQHSALPLIEALQIINDNPSRPFDDEKEGDKVDTSKSDCKSGTVSFDYDKILADAKVFAEGDETMQNLIAQITVDRTVSSRGAVGGPRRHRDVVNANGYDVYNINFVGGRLAEIGVSGDGDTDLDLYVYDSNDNLIESDTDYTDDCYVSWTPRWTGRFRVKIVNRGPIANRYLLITN